MWLTSFSGCVDQAIPYTPSDGIGLAGNYSLAGSAGLSAEIAKAPLLVTANDAFKVVDGQPYSGGNGVRFAGFVDGDDVAVLGGTLRYGGPTQGAVSPGAYTIAVTGLAADNICAGLPTATAR
ncbi:hypothetical protein [Xanthomonas axonopodis]|uniref:hypothetical protein n=1 Tax=Xanthomonas axonopodis TaxID=53413 RepID=UPI0035592FAB